jgi:hypothetical protein
MGQVRSTCTPHLVVLLTTRNRSVFRRMYNTETSQRGPKRELLSLITITISCRFELCALEGRSTHAGKAEVSLSASLPGGVTHAGRSVFWSDYAEKKGQSLTLCVLLPTSSIPLVFFSSSTQRGAACALVSGIRVS